MTNDQKMLKRKREERETVGTQVRALMAKPELSDSEQAERDDLMKRSLSLDAEIEYLKQTVQAAGDSIETREIPTDRQASELDDLFRRSSVSDFINEPYGYAVEGASREYRDELGMGPGFMPIDFIMGQRLETRADAVTNISATDAPEENQHAITLPIMAGSSAEYLGINRPVVPVGTQTYVAIDSKPTADYRLDGVRKDSEKIGITVKSVDPVRVTSRVSFGIETPARVKGFESVITPLLRGAVNDKLDAVAISGQAAVNNVSPKIEGLIADLTSPDDPTAVASWTDYYSVYPGRVDGKLSMDGSNVRLLVAPDVFKKAAGLQIATSGDLLIDRLPAGRFKASANVPAAGNNKIGTGVSYTSGNTGLYQPVWRQSQVIRDELTNAAEGQVNVTIMMLSGLALVDATPYSLHKWKLA